MPIGKDCRTGRQILPIALATADMRQIDQTAKTSDVTAERNLECGRANRLGGRLPRSVARELRCLGRAGGRDSRRTK